MNLGILKQLQENGEDFKQSEGITPSYDNYKLETNTFQEILCNQGNINEMKGLNQFGERLFKGHGIDQCLKLGLTLFLERRDQSKWPSLRQCNMARKRGVIIFVATAFLIEPSNDILSFWIPVGGHHAAADAEPLSRREATPPFRPEDGTRQNGTRSGVLPDIPGAFPLIPGVIPVTSDVYSAVLKSRGVMTMGKEANDNDAYGNEELTIMILGIMVFLYVFPEAIPVIPDAISVIPSSVEIKWFNLARSPFPLPG